MNDTEITDLAIDCGALAKPNPKAEEIILITFTLEELKEFIEMLPKPTYKMTVQGGGG